MSAKVIDGKRIAQEIKDEIRLETENLKGQGIVPGLAVVLVGGDPASAVYVGNKEKTCREMGFYSEVHRLPEETTEAELVQLVGSLNRSDSVHGILVQLPLPKHINEKLVIDAIAVHKDVDSFSPQNTGNLVIGDESLLPCTPAGIIELIKRTGMDISGKHAVVIGRSNIVGKPVAMLLLRENATVTICHSRTENMERIAAEADILVVAIGKPKAIDSRFIKPGAVVIDVGVNRLNNGKLAGDVDYDDCLDKASAITPVPGGVGPMTIAMLMKNTLKAAQLQAGV
ncbi:bifunctional methylenetetrahydrofolate dehydrogenase/methenyltetrahydrofolate cyclohydrolase FolD [Paenibacillus herberti]|uniref:Bifunctional protein FolD n=1 Tax=Paenibacillus herberti TaxID=1619309 RepID=A0A229P4F0_9BACL|nr:bifunctional methylenetetrahydrofolate dehydrogenase/methenyltetrahydrofolate cyclohydrolase FolD [Paenibacillus herberti]OXM16739.1 bifunctional methylenetetrahydrofolate dehydrogenase/methenyltetrahydrofolate cyclohydrolase [Paenibacillus herberti]